MINSNISPNPKP